MIRNAIVVFFISFYISFTSFLCYADEPNEQQHYKVSIGDVLDISVLDHDELKTKTPVLSDGLISFPYIGSINVNSRWTCLAQSAGLAYAPQGEAAEDDEATTWHIDYMYDVGLIIGGGTSQIQKNIIAERGLGFPREPRPGTASGAARS